MFAFQFICMVGP